MNVERLLELLGETEVFAPLQQRELAQLARVMEFREYRPGQVLVQQDEQGEDFLILVEGSARVLRENKVLKTEQSILTLRAGESLGETSLLSNEPRTATVKAMERTVCAILTRANFLELFEKSPSVSQVMARYLAQRLAAQCQLSGPVFVNLAQYPHRPDLFRLLPYRLLEQCEAAPLHLDGRLLTVAMVQPDSLSQRQLLKDELPGFQLEVAACSGRDLREYLRLYQLSSTAPKEHQIEAEEDPMDELVRLLKSQTSGFLTLEFGTDRNQLTIKVGRQLLPLPQQPGPEFFRAVQSSLSSAFLSHTEQEMTLKSRTVDNQTHYFEIARFKHRDGSRFSLKLVDTHVPPLSTILPSTDMRAKIREVLSTEQSILLLDAQGSKPKLGTFYSLVQDLTDAFGCQGVLHLGQSPNFLRINCTFGSKNVDLTSYASSAVRQGVQVVALPEMNRPTWLSLVNSQERLPAIVGQWNSGSVTKSFEFLTQALSDTQGCLHEFYILHQRPARTTCPHCRVPHTPESGELRELRSRSLNNEKQQYFKGAGCGQCGQTGQLGETSVIWLSKVRRSVTNPVLTEKTEVWSPNDYLRSVLHNGILDIREALRLSWA